MASFGQHLLHLIFPISCINCGVVLPADDRFRLCPSCTEKIPVIRGLVCQKCGLPLPDGGAHCYVCRQNPGYHFEYIRSVGTYEGILKDLIRKYKYQHRDYLDRLFGTMLADVVVSDPGLGSADVVVPVPIHWFKKVKRGYNQSELLANILAERLNKPLVKDMLSRTRYTRAQVRLKREERIANVQGCFTCHNTAVFHKKSVLVVDDVCTTAATLEECAKILRRAGASKVYGITLARD